MRLLSCSQIGPVLLNGRESNILGESRQTDSVKLGSLAVVEPLIIVCPDHVYLFKLFLVLRKHSPPQDIKHRSADVLAATLILPLLWLQVYGGDTQPDKQEDRGRCVWLSEVPQRVTFLTQLWSKLSGTQDRLAYLL